MSGAADPVRATSGLGLHWLALATSLLPLLTVHVTYVVSAAEGLLPWCVPYLERCASISATGRHGTAYYLFKAGMLPSAVLIIGYWWLVAAWLRRRMVPLRACITVVVVGVAAGLGLVLYSTVLGSIGEEFRTVRRMGIVLYFGTTMLAGMLFTLHLSLVARGGLPVPGLAGALRFKLGLCATLLVLGVGAVILQVVWLNYDAIEDSVEWWFGSLMATFPLGTAYLWYRDGSRLQLTTG